MGFCSIPSDETYYDALEIRKRPNEGVDRVADKGAEGTDSCSIRGD